MAVPDSQNIYDVLGTVLYRTVAVNASADDRSAVDADDAQNIPLDYPTALLALEAEENSNAAHKGTAAAAGNGGGGATQRSKVGSGAAHSASRLSLSAADGRSLTSASAAALSPGTGGRLPVPPAAPPHTTFTSVSGRYGMHNGSSAKAGGGAGPAAAATQTRKGSRAVAFEDSAAGMAGTVAARNTLVAKSAMLRGAGAGMAGRSVTQKAKRNLKNLPGASMTARVAAMPRAGDRPLTVAEAMELLFPVAPAEGQAEADDGSDEARRGSREGSASVSRAAADRSDAALPATAVGAGAVGEAAPRDVPRLWRRADVGHVSRLDAVLLFQHIQRRCAAESARPRGVVCPNREGIYRDALREVTRQVTLLCPERGLLLDELAQSMQQAIETYDVLLDSASQYAVRKSTERDLHQHLFTEKAELETEVRRREHRVSEWRAKYAGLQKRFEEQQAADGKLHEQEIAYAKRANAQLVNEIKRLASVAEKDKES